MGTPWRPARLGPALGRIERRYRSARAVKGAAAMTSPDRTAPDGADAGSAQPIPLDEEPTVASGASGEVPHRDHAGPVDDAVTVEVDNAVTVEHADPVEGDDALAGTIAALTEDDLDQSERRRLLGRLAGEIRSRGIGDLFRPRAA